MEFVDLVSYHIAPENVVVVPFSDKAYRIINLSDKPLIFGIFLMYGWLRSTTCFEHGDITMEGFLQCAMLRKSDKVAAVFIILENEIIRTPPELAALVSGNQ